jgi:hypothetical protein
MKYMMFIKHTEDYRGKTPPAGLMQAMGEFVGGYAKSGKLLDGNGLKATHKGKKVQMRNGKLRVVDGPFTESKEIIGGYALIEAESEQEAMEICTKFMQLHRTYWPEFEGECEMRPIETGMPGSD